MKALSFLRPGTFLGFAVALSIGGRNSASPSLGPASVGGDGQAGSMARFAILSNTLYAVENTSLRSFDLSIPTQPVAGPVVNVGVGVETIFPQAPNLFIGSQQGMFIYNVASGTPQRVGAYLHAVLRPGGSGWPLRLRDAAQRRPLRPRPQRARRGGPGQPQPAYAGEILPPHQALRLGRG